MYGRYADVMSQPRADAEADERRSPREPSRVADGGLGASVVSRPTYFPDQSAGATRPFVPGFGRTPPFLAGRSSLITELCAGLDAGPDDPRSVSVLLGARGMGKTVVLNEVEDAAVGERGWVSLSLAGTDGDLLTAVHLAVLRARTALEAEAADIKPRRRLDGLKVGASAFGAGVELGASWESDPTAASLRRTEPGVDLRYDLTGLAELAESHGSKVLLTLDEIHAVPAAHVRQLGSILQHIVMREGRAVAFLGAGLTYVVDTLLSHRSAATFLSRAPRFHISYLSDDEVRLGLSEPVRQSGGSVESSALTEAVGAIRGHPYLLQLVGAHSWDAAPAAPEPGAGKRIGLADVRVGIRRAERDLDDHLLRPTWSALSSNDRRFVHAMAADDGPSRIAALRERLGMSSQQVNNYRNRLMLAGMIRPVARGYVEYVYPDTQQWLAAAVKNDECP